ATLGEKLGLQAAQMADSLIPAVMNKVADTLAKANSTLVQMRDTKF
ncbi:protease SohB, partial [Acinetobacter baumannii]